ncbi:PucR family transcriptional regulator [Oceanobacillus senegalensis]|nr:PucR family transcriptional regulator [Oceanobacillus senegalensis]
MKNHTESMHSLIYRSMNVNSYKEHVLDNEYYTVFPIKGLGHTWGNLCLQKRSDELDEFSLSLIDRAALAIAQIMLRNRTIEERKQNQEEEIVQKLLYTEEYNSSTALKILPPPAKNLYYRLVLIDTNANHLGTGEEDWEEIKLQQSMMLRSIFKRHGFFPAMSVTKDKIAIIAPFYKDGHGKKENDNFTQVTNAINQIQEKNILDGQDLRIGISHLQKDYSYIARSYKEANDVLFIQKSNILDALFYEDIGVYRLLISIHDHGELESYVWDHLGALIEFDQKMNGNLLMTLSVYLETMGSKKETAKRLFIVRQTLYHRLAKIEELLGKEFMEPINRQAIELAISAYRLIEY